MKSTIVWSLVFMMSVGTAGQVSAQTPRDLANLDLEELMNVTIVSAARREQPIADAPAAIYGITQEDIRRSGLTSLPEVLRLAPGVQMAEANTAVAAVSVRGFNSPFSDKLLVLIDGRSIYNRTFSGEFWNSQDLVLEDIER